MADLKQIARRIFQETIAAIDIPGMMQRKLGREGMILHCNGTTIDLRSFSSLKVIAMGKAAHAMLEGLQLALPLGTQFSGIASAPIGPHFGVKGMEYFVGGHPTPNAQSLQSAEAILALLRESDEGTLVIFLLSGGGSALVELPLDPSLTLEDVQQVHRALVGCGAPIHEINSVRKHLSAVKGGRLTLAAGRAKKLTLAVSDVPQGYESDLASGPTLPDPSPAAHAEQVVQEYRLAERFPASLRSWIEEGRMPETPKGDEPEFANAHFSLLLGLDDLFHPAHHAAEAHGCLTVCDNSTDDWPVEQAADFLLERLKALKKENPGRRVAVIADGEVSSPVKGKGVGGRNAAFVLACVKKIAERKIAVLSAGTDGVDGNSPAAGAVADGETLRRGQDVGLNARFMFRESDSYSYFARLGDTIVTGPTGNNLRDLRILLAE
jgi:glycerate 2-kinase